MATAPAPRANDPASHADEAWMRVALGEARDALARGAIPVGAVLVSRPRPRSSSNAHVVAVDRAGNTNDSPLHHAEMLVLRRFANDAKEDLSCATLYVTMEPCSHCAGAVRLLRVGRVVWGCDAPLTGAAGSFTSVLTTNQRTSYPPVRVRGGVLASEAASLLRSFFQAKRLIQP